MNKFLLIMCMSLIISGCATTPTKPTAIAPTITTTTNSTTMNERINEQVCVLRETLDDSTFNPVAEVSAGDTYWEDDLIEVDATNLPNEPIVVGHTQTKWDQMTHDEVRAMVMALLRTGVIRTFAHIEADVCLRDEEFGKDGSYTANFAVTHTYFTKEENQASYTMSVTWDPVDRSVTVSPGKE